jgi:F-type H+-transporting ATPase subunit b
MSLDWQQLLTHAIGFLITLWLLKRIAWGPLLALLEERRNKIINEFKQIDDEKAAVAKQAAEYEARMKEIDAERRAKIVVAVEDGKKVASDIKATAQAEVKDMHVKAKAELEREVAKAKVQLKEEMISITMTAAEKVVREKMNDQKHRELIGRYIEEVQKA